MQNEPKTLIILSNKHLSFFDNSFKITTLINKSNYISNKYIVYASVIFSRCVCMYIQYTYLFASFIQAKLYK